RWGLFLLLASTGLVLAFYLVNRLNSGLAYVGLLCLYTIAASWIWKRSVPAEPDRAATTTSDELGTVGMWIVIILAGGALIIGVGSQIFALLAIAFYNLGAGNPLAWTIAAIGLGSYLLRN